MRVVNVSDVEQVVMAAGLTVAAGGEADWPDDLPVPATFAEAGSDAADAAVARSDALQAAEAAAAPAEAAHHRAGGHPAHKAHAAKTPEGTD